MQSMAPRRAACSKPSAPSMLIRMSSVAVFTGAGGAFCAGADLKAVALGDREKKRELGGHDTIAPMGPKPIASQQAGDRGG
jgi:hypothetical protein